MKKILSLLMLCAISMQGFSQKTENEPNNTVGTADTVNICSYVTGTMNPNNDIDYYWTYMPRAGVLTASIDPNAAGMSYSMSVYYQNGTNIAIGGGSVGGLNKVETIVPSGWYYVSIEQWSGNNSSTVPYKLTLCLDTSDKCEWNNDFASACLVNENSSIQAKLRGEDVGFTNVDADYYKVKPSKCGVFIINMPPNSANVRFEINLYDSATNNKIDGYYMGSAGIALTFENAVTDNNTYYVVVSSRGGKVSEQPYTLNLTLDTTDRSECNNTIPEAYSMNICDTVDVTMRPKGDLDYYSFVSNGKTIHAEVINVPSNLALALTAFDKNGQIGQPITSGIGQPVTLILTNSIPNETYHIRVTEFYNQTSPDAYKFLIRDSMCGVVSVNQLALNEPKTTIAPNPNKGSFSIKLDANQSSQAYVTITSTLGVIVKEFQIDANKDVKMTLDQPSGMYFVTITSEGHIQTKKIIISK